MVALGSGANRAGRVFAWVELYFFSFLPFTSLPEQLNAHDIKRDGARYTERQLAVRSQSQSAVRKCPCRAPAFMQSDAKHVQRVGLSNVGRVSRQDKDLA